MGEQDSKEKKSSSVVKHYEVEEVSNKKLGTDMNYRHKYVWQAVVVHVLLQIFWVRGMYVLYTQAKLFTLLWTYFIGIASAQAVGLGTHRGFSHRSFKMTPVMKFIFVIFHNMAGQNSIFTWVRDHRLHHKYSDTDADPHNSNRGFFFCHMGWLMVKPHPLVKEKGREIDISDILNDKLIMFERRYFLYIYFIVGFLIPVAVPVIFWQEDLYISLLTAYFARYVMVLHFTWAINSVAHLWGTRPYDKRLNAVESAWVTFFTLGDGSHNYHHTFPWDYRHSLPRPYNGIATPLLDLFAYLGLIYDLRTAPPKTVFNYLQRNGDGTHGKLKVLEEFVREPTTKTLSPADTPKVKVPTVEE